MSPAAKRPLPGFGHKGVAGKRGQAVRATIEPRAGADVVVVRWREPQGDTTVRRQESWPSTPAGRAEAKAFGEGTAERLAKLAAGVPVGPSFTPRTVRELWDAYVLAEWDSKRTRTHANYGYNWRKFELWFGAHRVATELTREHLDAFRRDLRKTGVEVNQVGHILAQVKRVYAWAVDRDLIPPTKVTAYRFKVGKDEKRLEVPEYTREEAGKILAQWDPRDPQEWRPWAAVVLFSVAGPRANAALHLEWRDIDFAAGTVTWREERAKTGERHVQPLPASALDALWVAYGWRTALGYEGPYVFFRPAQARREISRGRVVQSKRRAASAAASADKPWTYQAFNGALHRAEKEAGVARVQYRAAHGFRRLVVGDVLAATGNLVLAGQYIGDRDLRTLRKSYVRTRPEELRGAADVFAKDGAK